MSKNQPEHFSVADYRKRTGLIPGEFEVECKPKDLRPLALDDSVLFVTLDGVLKFAVDLDEHRVTVFAEDCEKTREIVREFVRRFDYSTQPKMELFR